jgi:hypothetical protein
MKKAIEAFGGAQGFADLAQKLNHISELIKSNKPSDGKYTPEYRIPCKPELAKVLALSLNPACSDSHGKTLEVYAAVFGREKQVQTENKLTNFGDSLGLFYGPLFNAFNNLKQKEKKAYIAIIKDYVVKWKEELVVSFPGFIIAMIHGLDDFKAEERKPFEEILDEAQKVVGTSRFFGEIWKTMLRSPKCCEPAIKYLDSKIPRNPRDASQKEDKIHESEYIMGIYNSPEAE